MMLPAIENVKNRFLIPESSGDREMDYVPNLYIEAKIDFSDIRTGFREAFSLSRVSALPTSRIESLWDEAAASDFDPEALRSAAPEKARFRALPPHVDRQYMSGIETQFIQHLLRTFSVKVYRNFNLNAYSCSGESRNDFIIRCIELIRTPIHREFDQLHEVFNRKLERLQQKYLNTGNPEEPDGFNEDSRKRELINRVSERISALFLRTEFSIQRVSRPTGNIPGIHEFEERLQSLHFEAQESVARILDSYEDKAKSIDEYILHPTLKDIHCVSGYILWMPAGAD